MSEDARLTPLPPEGWPDAMTRALAALRVENPRHPYPPRDPNRPKGAGVMGMFAHHPDLAFAYNTFNGHLLFGTTLTVRQRELIVLRVAHRRRCDYEWAQHAVMSTEADISPDEVEAVRSGAADGWTALEAAVLTAVDELIDDARIGTDTWATLTAEFDAQQMLDLVFTVGAYDALAMALRTFDIEIDDDVRALLRK